MTAGGGEATASAVGGANGKTAAPAATPVISAVVCAYNSRRRIDIALQSLATQDLGEPYEVIVVASGDDGTAEYVAAAHPGVRVVRSRERLWPGPARNRGVEAAVGEYVAFLPDDGVAAPDWLRRRVAKHREGYDAVGGAITNGTPWSPVGSAGYYLEYSALIPALGVLAEQAIPHCLSYRRALFGRLGPFPDDVETGEDTLFNERCLESGVLIGFDARVRLAHRNLKRVDPYLRHQYAHGRGLVQCVERYDLESPVGPLDQGLLETFWRMFVRYPGRRWFNALRRIARGKRSWALGYVVVSPLVWAGLWATSAGAWNEWRRLRRAGSRD